MAMKLLRLPEVAERLGVSLRGHRPWAIRGPLQVPEVVAESRAAHPESAGKVDLRQERIRRQHSPQFGQDLRVRIGHAPTVPSGWGLSIVRCVGYTDHVAVIISFFGATLPAFCVNFGGLVCGKSLNLQPQGLVGVPVIQATSNIA